MVGGVTVRKYTVAYIVAVIVWFAFLVYTMTTTIVSAEPEQKDASVVVEYGRLAGDDTPAAEPLTYEDIFRETANAISDCRITYYCAEEYAHICGTGDGITATGVPVTAGWTCAVDPDVIPYGAEVMIDYGDSVAFYKAQDCGFAIRGNRIDLAVESHSEALERGVGIATVYFLEVNNG